MAKLLGAIKGKAIVSLNDHPDIRKAFASFHMESTDLTYTVGGGKVTDAKEVLIFSGDIKEDPAGLL